MDADGRALRTLQAVSSKTWTVALVATLAACADETPPVTAADYRTALGAICAESTERLEALPPAPDQIAVVDLATSVASILDNEAARAERLEVPDDDVVEADHRAFVRNTDEQADAWRVLTTADADVVATTDLIRQLVAGRNDLVADMGVAGCRRDGT
jgi:hypothetical protein